MADTATAPADAGNKKVERPDEAKFKAELAEREVQLANLEESAPSHAQSVASREEAVFQREVDVAEQGRSLSWREQDILQQERAVFERSEEVAEREQRVEHDDATLSKLKDLSVGWPNDIYDLAYDLCDDPATFPAELSEWLRYCLRYATKGPEQCS